MKKNQAILILLFLLSFTVFSCGSGDNTVVIPSLIVALNTGDSISSIEVDQSIPLNATAVYSDAKQVNVSQTAQWSSSNTTFATIDKDGTLYAHQPGVVIITVNFAKFTRQITINVLPKLINLEIIYDGERFETDDLLNLGLTATYSDDSTLDVIHKATWLSLDPSIATIESSGRIKGKSIGEVEIKTSFRHLSASRNFSVHGPIKATISGLNSALELEQSILLEVSLEFSDGIDKDITDNLLWDYDKFFVNIDDNNLLTTLNPGTTNITFIYKNTRFENTVTINPHLTLFLQSDLADKLELTWQKRASNSFVLYRKPDESINVNAKGEVEPETTNQGLEIINLPESANIYDKDLDKNRYIFENLDRNTDYYFRISALKNNRLTLSDNELKVRPRVRAWFSNSLILDQSEQQANIKFGDTLYTFGGQTTSGESTTFSQNLSAYNLLTQERLLVSILKYATSNMAVCADNSYIYMLGGLILDDTDTINTSSQNARYHPATNSWKTDLAILPEPLEGHQCTIVNEKIYVFGGNNESTVSDSVHIYDITENLWTTDAVIMNPARTEFSLAKNNDIIYLSGGIDAAGSFSDTFQSYAPESNQWTALPDLEDVLAYHSSVFYKDKLYIAGGETKINEANTATSKVLIYDNTLATPVWSEITTRLATERSRHSAFVHASTLHVSTGINPNKPSPSYLSTVENFDLDKFSWLFSEQPTTEIVTLGPVVTSASIGNDIYFINARTNEPNAYKVTKLNIASNTLDTPGAGAGLGLVNKKYPKAINVNNVIYVFSVDNIDTNVHIFDPAQEDSGWSIGETLDEDTSFSSITAVADKVYFIGGFPDGKQVNVYDTTNNSWSTLQLSIPRGNNPTTVAFEDVIYVMGGQSDNPSKAINSVERHDVKTNNEWQILTPMNIRRASATSQVINGKVYIFGGENTKTLSSVEAFDPLSNTWTTMPSMPTSRANMSSEMINDIIYLFGGYADVKNKTPLSSIEIFR